VSTVSALETLSRKRFVQICVFRVSTCVAIASFVALFATLIALPFECLPPILAGSCVSSNMLATFLLFHPVFGWFDDHFEVIHDFSNKILEG
jgi:hypothetical protein